MGTLINKKNASEIFEVLDTVWDDAGDEGYSRESKVAFIGAAANIMASTEAARLNSLAEIAKSPAVLRDPKLMAGILKELGVN
jgi:hypothetical protein